MITRRTFLKASAGAAAGLILPSWLVKAEKYIEIEEEPFLERPNRVGTTIYAVDFGLGEYQMSLGDPREDIPDVTWRDLLDNNFRSGVFEELNPKSGLERLKWARQILAKSQSFF